MGKVKTYLSLAKSPIYGPKATLSCCQAMPLTKRTIRQYPGRAGVAVERNIPLSLKN